MLLGDRPIQGIQGTEGVGKGINVRESHGLAEGHQATVPHCPQYHVALAPAVTDRVGEVLDVGAKGFGVGVRHSSLLLVELFQHRVGQNLSRVFGP